MIKGLQSVIYDSENVFKVAIDYTTYDDLQNIIQLDLSDLLEPNDDRLIILKEICDIGKKVHSVGPSSTQVSLFV